MTPFTASLCSCALRKSLPLLRPHLSGRFACCMLGLFISAPALAEGTDVAAEEMYSDDVTVTTFVNCTEPVLPLDLDLCPDGEPLDINGDGNVDLAVASNSADTTLRSRYYPGNGDGTFAAPVLLTTGQSSEIVAADFNGDTFVDLVQGIRDRNSHLYLGMPPAEIDPSTHFNILDEDRVLAVAVGDLDDDGDLDLVTGTGHPNGEPSTPDNLFPNRFYLNETTDPNAPQFSAGADISPDADDTRSIALADMDGDGDLDVIVGNDETTPGSNRVYLNQFVESGNVTVSFGDGVDFGPPDDQTSKILIGDLNDDDQPDIVALNFVATGSPGINRFFLNETAVSVAFTLGAATDVSADASRSSGGALADFDGDGDLDIAVANLTNGVGTARNRLYLNQYAESGNVSFVGSDITADEHRSRELAAGDVDGDGDIDIVVGNEPVAGDEDTVAVPGRDRIYLNNGSEAPFTDAEVPSFTSTPVTEATVEVTYTYDVTVTDPEGDPVTIAAATTLPEWLTLTDNGNGTATLTGTPAASDLGDHAVSLEASDDNGNSAMQDFTITVSETPAGNSSPEFTSTAVTAATEGEAYTYDITASDADDDTLTIEGTTVPGWLTLTDNGDGTATLSGTPAAADVGEHDVSLQVSDGTDTATQDFTVTVEAASSEPPPSEPPPDNGGGGGGGSLGLCSLLVLIGFGAAGRRRRIG